MSIPEFRRGRALLGFMGDQETRDFLNGLCVVQDQTEMEAYKNKWALAAETVSGLRPRVHSPVNQRDLAESYSDYVKQLSDQPMFRQLFGSKVALREVELEHLVCFQRYVDTEHSTELAAKMRSSDKYILESCLPLEFRQDVQVSFDQAVPGVAFSSVSPKLQFAGLQITGFGGPEITYGGQPVKQVGVLLLIGTQPNYVQVVEYKDRYFLKNGYHRAYAALLSNRKQIPAVVSESEDFTGTGALNAGFFPRDLLLGDAPPLVTDFLNERVAIDVKLKPMRKVIRVRADEFLVPR